MMDLEHPTITKVNLTGYAAEDKKAIFVDDFGFEIFEGDEVAVFDDFMFLADELSSDAVNVLKTLGASFVTAKEGL